MMLVNKLAYRYRLARDLARDVVRGRRSRLDVVVELLYRLARVARRVGPPRRARGGRRRVPLPPAYLRGRTIVLTDLCTLAGAILRRRVFVTDLGFTSEHYGDRYPLNDFVDGFLAISEFAAARHREMLEDDQRPTTNDQRDGVGEALSVRDDA